MLRAIFAALVAVAGLAPAFGGAEAQLLANGDFDTDIVPWVDLFPAPGTAITWSEIDAAEPSPSGSLQLQTLSTNGGTTGPVGECLVAMPGTYTLSARMFVQSSAGEQAYALAGVDFFESAICNGPFLSGGPAAYSSGVDAWETTSTEVETPSSAAAMRVYLLVGNTFDTIPDVARFDEIRLVPEPGTAAGGVVALLALAAAQWRTRRVAHRFELVAGPFAR